MTGAAARRNRVRDKYREILGRNIYSQARRNYCYRKYSDGKYYSDCSSSVSYAYQEAGEGFGIMRTTDMYATSKFVDVPVTIQNGRIRNPEVLRIGDMLLFAGTDAGRKKWGYVGHVEMVGETDNGKIVLYGHGSGRPRKRDMTAYCKSRFANKTQKTPLGHTGLIRVRRYIRDDDPARDGGWVQIGGGTVYVRSGPGIDQRILGVVRRGERYAKRGEADGWFEIDYEGRAGWVSGRYSREVK